jgi:hypothetical protein
VRAFLILIVIVALGWLFLRQKQNEKAAVPMQSATASSPALTPAPRGQASEYNYMKRTLDRARDVRDQSRSRTQADQDPR